MSGHRDILQTSIQKKPLLEKKKTEPKWSDVGPNDGERLWYRADILHDVSQGVLRKLIIVSIVCITFIIVEIVGGVLANSLAI